MAKMIEAATFVGDAANESGVTEMASKQGVKKQPETALSQLRKKLGWSQREMARALCCTDRAVSEWENNHQQMSDVYAAKFNELEQVYNKLSAVVKPDYVGQWLKLPQSEYGQLSALDLISKGMTDQLWSTIFYLKSGTPR